MLEKILIGIVILVSLIILLSICIYGVKSYKNKHNSNKGLLNDNKIITKGENMISDEVTNEAPPMKLVIAQGDTIEVGSTGRIPCGQYILESCDGEETFNVRIGRYVKEYKNGCTVILTEKQKVTPVSTSIILR